MAGGGRLFPPVVEELDVLTFGRARRRAGGTEESVVPTASTNVLCAGLLRTGTRCGQRWLLEEPGVFVYFAAGVMRGFFFPNRNEAVIVQSGARVRVARTVLPVADSVDGRVERVGRAERASVERRNQSVRRR